MIRTDKISFIGLGKLGLPLATTFAKGGVEVVGIDKNKTLINLLSEGELPFYETGLRKNLNEANGKITYTHKYKEVIDETDISVILVNTQIGQSYSSIYVKSAIKDVCQELKKSEMTLSKQLGKNAKKTQK